MASVRGQGRGLNQSRETASTDYMSGKSLLRQLMPLGCMDQWHGNLTPDVERRVKTTARLPVF